MKILLLGDIHGEWQALDMCIGRALAVHKDITHIIQLGDFGYGWPKGRNNFSLWVPPPNAKWRKKGIPFMFIDGNHENFDYLETYEGTGHPDIKWIRRGSVIEIEEYKILACGGAESIDKVYRTPGISWWPQENITQKDFDIAMSRTGPFNAIISHERADSFDYTLPRGAAKLPFGKSDRFALEQIRQKFKPDFWFFGHYHQWMSGKVDNTLWNCVPMIGLYNPGYYMIWDGKTVWNSIDHIGTHKTAYNRYLKDYVHA